MPAMRLDKLDLENSISILSNIKEKLAALKKDTFVLPEGEYKKYDNSLFDGMQFPLTVNLLIAGNKPVKDQNSPRSKSARTKDKVDEQRADK
ncbi:unnamed protein product [Thelazia callipaeda]|uniref:FKBP_N domain-containing protein n=1 Tax=Thelazia callipaeda TaxID=103827 RepID=A0A0N5CMA7_THECL|nr:unnamed protein product [Thelazia callipaeda]